MKIAAAIFGIVVLAAVFVVWFRAYKSIKGDDEALFSTDKKTPKTDKASLEDFIAAYRRGEVTLASDVQASVKPAASIAPAPAAAPSPPAPSAREAFLSGATKLAYLVCKTGLRDHHVFAHVPLSALADGGAIDPALTRAGVDLLICNAAMTPVAAIDMVDAGKGAAPSTKADYLKSLGIRYLRMSPKSLPRPDELHGLLYKI